MKGIVVGIDGSEASQHALRHAVELASATRAPLHLVHAVVLPALPIETTGVGLPQLLAGHHQWADRLLRDAKRWLPPEVTVEDIVRDGAPTEVLNAVAAERGADLIVVGNTGRGAVGRMLVGSTADRLIHTATRPVLVVR